MVANHHQLLHLPGQAGQHMRLKDLRSLLHQHHLHTISINDHAINLSYDSFAPSKFCLQVITQKNNMGTAGTF
jgi:hypothetical protein